MLGYYPPAHALVGSGQSRNDPAHADLFYSRRFDGDREIIESQYPFAFRSVRNVHSEGASFPIEGAYLKGYGVVFTTVVPRAADTASPEKSADKPSSPWERERRELRGDKPEAAPKTAGPTPVREVVLGLLAENGEHFTELAPDERVAVAVVFRPGRAALAQQ